MVKKEISSDQNWKDFWETSFRCVNATQRVTRFSSVFSFLTHFSGNLHWDTCERNEGCCDKGYILRWKLERSFVRNFWWCVNSSHRVTLMFHAAVHYHCFWGTWEGLLWIALRPTLKREISSVQNVKEFFEKLLCELWIPPTELLLSSQEAVC